MKIKKIHIGEEIKNLVEKKYPSYAAFARKIGKTRQCLQTQIFSKQSLQTEMLVRLSEELDVNLFELYQSNGKSVHKKSDTPTILLCVPICNCTEEELTESKVSEILEAYIHPEKH